MNRSEWEKTLDKGLKGDRLGSHSEIIDLFSGCGGLSLGFQAAGFETIKGFDSWDAAVRTYNMNFAHNAEIVDLSDVDASIDRLSVYQVGSNFPSIVGGPPCQDFSMAGRRTEGKNAALTSSFAHLVSNFRPLFFLMENVPNAQRFETYNAALESVRQSGYEVTLRILDASDFGAPQRRKRLFAFGSTDPYLTELFSEEIDAERSAALEKIQDQGRTTVREWLDDLELTPIYYRHPRSYNRRGLFSVDEPSPTIRGVNRPMPKTYNFNDMDKAVPGFYELADPKMIQPLSADLRKQIQTFPKHFRLPGPKTTNEQLVGNAVPVLLAYIVATALRRAIERRDQPESSDL